MLTIESILDIFVDVDLINHLVGIVLKSCCEDDNLKELRHQLDEINTARTHQEVTVASILNVMNQGLI